MQVLNPGLFLVPGIALFLVIVAYLYFFRRVPNKFAYRKYIVLVAGLAFLLNFLWEVSQGFLYVGYQYDWKHISFCALASVADVVMVLILFYGFVLVYGEIGWTQNLTPIRVALLTLAGGAGAIVAEKIHTARGSWSYTDAMPMLLWVNVGLIPVLQFTVLPLLVFCVIPMMRMRQRNSKSKENRGNATYTCPRHLEVKSDKPGNCPKCGMALVKGDN
ncbi:heavy metal-binding domain-containing protein [Spirosoma luteum]|uniref:heavy metal-binding domain-containing protein n=1 Tax=Spirosoma luteum TaxID=431553 RepID=UPI00036EC94B|nr:heavy metal-binding domain-containing protein [Spirosoma luteum]